MSYTIDVYRRFIRPERDFVRLRLLRHVLPAARGRTDPARGGEDPEALAAPAVPDLTDFAIGLRRILFGLFLKVVLADNLAPAGRRRLRPADRLAHRARRLDAGLPVRLPDLLRLQRLLAHRARLRAHDGHPVPRELRLPVPRRRRRASSGGAGTSRCRAGSATTCTCRWPARAVRDDSTGGLATAAPATSRSEARRTRRALFATWAIMGLWHGANWTFVLWGLYHALLVYGYRKLTPRVRLTRRARARGRCSAGVLLTLPLVMLGWIPFRAPTRSARRSRCWRKVFDPAAVPGPRPAREHLPRRRADAAAADRRLARWTSRVLPALRRVGRSPGLAVQVARLRRRDRAGLRLPAPDHAVHLLPVLVRAGARTGSR